MTNKEIINGLKYRIKNLTDSITCLRDCGSVSGMREEAEARLDEVESVLTWIKENVNNSKQKEIK